MTDQEMIDILYTKGYKITPPPIYLGNKNEQQNEITISLISGNTWTDIITNSDLNGKINKQKVWNALTSARESDGYVSSSTGFIWRIITGHSNYTAIIKLEQIQDNTKETYYTRLNSNSKTYTMRLDGSKYHIYGCSGDGVMDSPTITTIKSTLSIEAIAGVIFNKTFFVSNSNLYYRSGGIYKISQDIYQWTLTYTPFFQDSPSFRPQFTFKEES